MGAEGMTAEGIPLGRETPLGKEGMVGCLIGCMG